MTARYTRTGKQVLCDGKHFADAADETAAQSIVDALANYDAMACWADISTAPRDGTIFDAWTAYGYRLADVVWEERYGMFFRDDDGVLGDQLTHWTPLPLAPVAPSDRPADGIAS